MKRQSEKNTGMRLADTARSASGLYTVSEAALYAKMSPITLGQWLYGNKTHSPLRETIIPKDEGKFITFMEFVEALAIRTLRGSYGISLQKIRGALDEAKKTYQIDYPFSQKNHQTVICGTDLHVFINGAPNPVQLSGNGKRQQSFRPCIEQFMRDLKFNDKETAMAYVAYRYPVLNEPTIEVTMDPRYCFGDPVVEGYRAETLWRAALAEGSEERASEYYEVNLNAVVAACRYCEEIKMAA